MQSIDVAKLRREIAALRPYASDVLKFWLLASPTVLLTGFSSWFLDPRLALVLTAIGLFLVWNTTMTNWAGGRDYLRALNQYYRHGWDLCIFRAKDGTFSAVLHPASNMRSIGVSSNCSSAIIWRIGGRCRESRYLESDRDRHGHNGNHWKVIYVGMDDYVIEVTLADQWGKSQLKMSVQAMMELLDRRLPNSQIPLSSLGQWNLVLQHIDLERQRLLNELEREKKASLDARIDNSIAETFVRRMYRSVRNSQRFVKSKQGESIAVRMAIFLKKRRPHDAGLQSELDYDLGAFLQTRRRRHQNQKRAARVS